MKIEEKFMNDIKALYEKYIDEGLKLDKILEMSQLYITTLQRITKK